jgi:hypothetical protein
MFGRLHIAERGRPERVVELTGTATIGRTDDNDIVLDSEGVSQCHAMLMAQSSGVLLVDLGSAFGTFVDAVAAPPDEPVRLADGARISIGRAALRYTAPRRATSPPPAPSSPHPPLLATPYLNTRLDVPPGKPISVDQRVPLLVWVGAPIGVDERQSSRPLEWTSLAAEPTALRVRVRVASPSWRVLPEQPVLLAVAWGSAQVARYELVALRPERTRISVRLDLVEERSLLQYFRLGVCAVGDGATGTVPAGGDQLGCPRCGAAARAGARFCTRCGALL